MENIQVVEEAKNMTAPKLSVVDKLDALLEEQSKEIAIVKELYDSLRNRQKIMQKVAGKIRQKMSKPIKTKANRKPCGFARPTPVSKEMCEFLNKPEGSEVSRTTVTRALIQYIKEKKLQNPSNKKQIQPDETLYKLFGETARSQDLTYFTMQKFVNHHFVKVRGT